MVVVVVTVACVGLIIILDDEISFASFFVRFQGTHHLDLIFFQGDKDHQSVVRYFFLIFISFIILCSYCFPVLYFFFLFSCSLIFLLFCVLIVCFFFR